MEHQPVVLHADQEHSGIRLVIFISLFIAYFLSYQLVYRLLLALAPDSILDYAIFLSCVGGLPVALLSIWGLEGILKRVWHSGLSLELDSQGITVHDQRRDVMFSSPVGDSDRSPAITWGGNLTQLNWYFPLSGYPRGGRERRVSAKWLCRATELQQDGARLNVFALMPPKQAVQWTGSQRLDFRRLNPAGLYTTTVRTRLSPPSRPTIPNELLHSKDGRYWLAERRRWEYGVELTPKDFATLMNYAQAGMHSGDITGESHPAPIV